MTDATQRMVDAEAADAALKRFLSPAFAVVRADYTAKLLDFAARPMTGDALKAVEKMALAIKVVNEAEKQIAALVADGEVARREADHAGDMARLSAEQRRWAQP